LLMLLLTMGLDAVVSPTSNASFRDTNSNATPSVNTAIPSDACNGLIGRDAVTPKIHVFSMP
jgi:hypothetical protein